MANELPKFNSPLGGRPLSYKPKELAEKFAEFVQWCNDNPIVITEKQSGFTGDNEFAKNIENSKPRLVSVGAFLVFLGKSKQWWSDISTGKQQKEFSDLKLAITAYCENYQIEMAASGIYKENIISRLLGLPEQVNFSKDKFVEYEDDEEESDNQ